MKFPKLLPLLLGFNTSGILTATICGTRSLLEWDAKGMFWWGLILIVAGVTFKTLFDSL